MIGTSPPRATTGDEPTVTAEPIGQAGVGLEAGQLLGARFEITQRLGEGGAAIVYAARDRLLGEPVALKLLHPRASGTAEVAALRAEVRAARRIAHANVCRVHDLCEHAGRVFLVMELLTGETLRQRLRHGISVAESVDVLRQLGAGLAAAHHAGVVHCDVKPENTFVGAGRVVLTDFGIARRLGDVQMDGHVEGTPAYMAPEQLLGAQVDERTDVYALAALAFELFAGRPPHGALGQVAMPVLVQRVLSGNAQLPAGKPDGLPTAAQEAVRATLARALSRNPEARWGSVEAFMTALLAALGGLATAPPAVPDAGMSGPREQTTEPARPAAKAAVLVERALGGRTAKPRGVRRLAAALELRVDTPDADEDERLVERADALVAAAEAALTDAGGLVVGRSPRGLVAVFGAQVSRGDEPLRAAETARALVAVAGAGLAVRAGLETGRLLIREGARLLVSGDALEQAARLCGGAEAGEIVVGPRAARHLARRYLIDGSRLGDRRPFGERPAPMVGREAELALVIDGLLGPLLAGGTGSTLVLAAPGLGKSRLAAEVLEVLAARGGLTLVSAAGEPGQAFASHGVVRTLLRRLAGEGGEADADEAAASLLPGADQETGSGAQASKALRSALAALLAGASGTGPGPAALPAARAALAATAARTQLVLVVDDAHWADDGTLELLEDIGRGGLGAPVALLVLARPELAELRPRLRASFARTVDLAPLPPGAAAELAARCLGEGADPAAVRALAGAAEGNPFFVEELAAELGEGATIAVLPSTIEETLQARLDRLVPVERELLRAAAVLGNRFRRLDLLRLADASELHLQPGELDDRVASLEARRLLGERGADDMLSFRHALLRDAVYRELTPDARRALHTAAAAVWRLRLAEDGDEGEGQTPPDDATVDLVAAAGTGPLVEMARHLEGADKTGEAAALLRRAGDRAMAQRARGEALRCYGEARRLLGERSGPELLVDLAEAAADAASYPVVDEAIAAALARLPTSGGGLAARAHAVHAVSLQHRARWDESLAAARQGLLRLGEDGARRDPALAARLYGQIGWVLGYILGDNAHGLPESERAVALLEKLDRPADLSAACSRLGANYMRAGRWRDQLACNRRALELAEAAGALELRARAHLNLGVNLSALGELGESLTHTRRALTVYERMATTALIALARNNLAATLCDSGRLAEASAELDEALRLDARLGGLYFRVEAGCTRARLLARQGELDAALHAADAARERAVLEGSTLDEGMARRVGAAIRSLAGRHDEALAELAIAESLVESADLGEAARVLAERSRVLFRAGRDAEGQAVRELAGRRLAGLGAALDLAKLAELAWL